MTLVDILGKSACSRLELKSEVTLRNGNGLFERWLLQRQPKLVTDDHWQLIDAHERSAGEPTGRPRVKLTSLAELLRIGHG